MKKGIVFLVGAGPGDPGLITLSALKAIESADTVVYDRLVSDAVMAFIPHGATKFFVGKSCKEKTLTQEEINNLLITLARKGQKVVRLKGGDPFLFGRGGEEALALAHARIPFEIIPGVTSAQACSAYAGVPLTHRGLASGVRFITGHRQINPSPIRGEDRRGENGYASVTNRPHPYPPPNGEGIDELELNWKSLADPDTTLVVYMGLVNLQTIAEKLMEHGLSAATPAIAIEQGSMASQRIVNATLDKISYEVSRSGLQPPSLVIIGKVASLSMVLQWFKSGSEEPPAAFTKMSY